MKTTARNRQTFPIGLLAEGRQGLIVGGGKVAAHKAKLLLDARADVTVVSPEAGDEVAALAESKAIQHLRREFQDSDIDGMFMVFAATDDKTVNRRVIESCRNRGVLCCSVDGNWIAGDFVTPAIFRKDELTVSVSTGGRSCRRSRMVKENLSRHIEMVETADLIVMGTSHEQLSVERREPYHLIGKRLERLGRMLTHVWGVHEFMLLNTCNRVELHGIITKGTEINILLARVMGFDRLAEKEYYIKQGFEAFEHVAVLSAGLYSQVPGENHIVSQIKDALEVAAKAGWAHGMMQEWISAALHVSKDIRSVSGTLLRNFEIEDLCMDYLEKECPDLKNRRVIVLGTGVVGKEAVRRFFDMKQSVDWFYHLNKPEVPEAWKGRVTLYTFDELRDRLLHANLIICATDSPHHLLYEDHQPFFAPGVDVLIVDLAMPRNVSPALDGATPHLKVVDLEDLKHWYRREQADMGKILKLSSQTVNEHMSLYEKIVRSFQGGNAVE